MRIAIAITLIMMVAVIWGFNSMIEGQTRRDEVYQSSAGELVVHEVVGRLEHPWAVAFLPGDEMLITERRGRLLHFTADGARNIVYGLPPVEDIGQGGLLDVVIARDFAESRTVFLTYAAPDGAATRTTLVSGRLHENGERLEDVRVLWQQDPAVSSSRHFGSRIVEAPDGTIWATIGDRAERPFAQDLDKTIGKVIRVNRDGSIPEDNPFVGQEGVKPEIWSYGHRNPQGAALDPETGALLIHEHGARGGDEINRPEAGKNYGWPIISFGVHYSGQPIGEGSQKEGMEQPLFYWDPSIAPSGMMIYQGDMFPEWKGDMFVGALKFELISRLTRDGDTITEAERLFAGQYGRVRDVAEGPDGAIYFLTDASEGRLFRVSPAE